MYIVFILCIVISKLFNSVLCEEYIECHPSKFRNRNEENGEIIIYKAYLNISYYRNSLIVYKYDGFQSVNFLLENVHVSSIVEPVNEYGNRIIRENEIIGNSNVTVAGIGKMMKASNDYDRLTDCDLYIIENPQENEKTLKQFQIEIIERLTFCMRSKLCKKLEAIYSDDLNKASEYPFEFGPLSVDEETRENEILTSENPTCYVNSSSKELNNTKLHGIQDTLNKLVDILLFKMTTKIKEMNDGIVQIADINTTLSFFGSADLLAQNGSFEDITLLQRRDDISLSNNGVKFEIACTFGLDEGYISYEKYELSTFFGIYEGELNATVRNIDLKSIVEINYDEKPCKAKLQELRVTKLGDIQISLTGLGALSNMLSVIVSWSTAFFQDEITRTLETKFKNFLEIKLKQYDCDAMH